MQIKPLRWIKFKRWTRMWAEDVWSESIAPLTDANARLNYFVVAVLVFFLHPKRSDERTLSQIITSLDGVEAVLWSLPVFGAMNAVLGLFRVAKKERQLGEWFGPKYVYHEPLHVATLLVDASHNGTPHELRVPNVEDESLVAYRIDIDRVDERVKTQLQYPGGHGPTFNWAVVSKATRSTIRLPPSRRMNLFTEAQQEATATTIRVYVLGFEVGKG